VTRERCQRALFARLLLVGLMLLLAHGSARADAGQQPPAHAADLQAPAQRSTRFSAYALPDRMWSIDVSVLGANADDVFGLIGVARGFKYGFQLDLNFVHWGAGLFNTQLRWNFLDTPHFGLGAELGFNFVHGAWVWLLGERAQQLIEDLNLLVFPISVTASAPVNRWLQFDLKVEYRHGMLFGTLGEGTSFVAETEIGSRQVIFRPTTRLYVSDATALEVSAKLPAFNRVPYNVEPGADSRFGKSRDGFSEVPFADSWTLEFGVRSRLRTWLFATLSVQYGKIPREVYGSTFFPKFGLEFRL
jgi:hypothetical protein